MNTHRFLKYFGASREDRARPMASMRGMLGHYLLELPGYDKTRPRCLFYNIMIHGSGNSVRDGTTVFWSTGSQFSMPGKMVLQPALSTIRDTLATLYRDVTRNIVTRTLKGSTVGAVLMFLYSYCPCFVYFRILLFLISTCQDRKKELALWVLIGKKHTSWEQNDTSAEKLRLRFHPK